MLSNSNFFVDMKLLEASFPKRPYISSTGYQSSGNERTSQRKTAQDYESRATDTANMPRSTARPNALTRPPM